MGDKRAFGVGGKAPLAGANMAGAIFGGWVVEVAFS